MIEAFIRLIQSTIKPNANIAEVGVFRGETSIHYLPLIKATNSHAYLVDWFCGNEGAFGLHEYNPDNKEFIKEELISNINDDNYEKYVTILDGPSIEMAKNIPDHSLDICFLDADHRYQNVKKDIDAYLPKVKHGGILAGHDLERFELSNSFTDAELLEDYLIDKHCHPGVIQAVYDKFGNDIEVWEDYGQFRIPIWVKKL